MLDLPAESAYHVAHDGNRKASFAIRESDDPLVDFWPFLLIVRTVKFVTVHQPNLLDGYDRFSTYGYSEFPAYGRLHSSISLWRGATLGARTQISFTLGSL